MQIRKTSIFTLLGFIFVLFIFSIAASNTLENNYLVYLSKSGSLNCYNIVNNKIDKLYSLLDIKEWHNVVWPTYDSNLKTLFVEALGRDKLHSCIVKIDYRNNTWSKPEIIIDKGSKPSISPSGKLLAYYLHPNRLIIFALGSKQEEVIANDIENRDPPIWISDNEIIYRNKFRRIVKIDIKTKQKSFIDFKQDLFPSAISPDMRHILLYTSKGNAIYLYNVIDKKLNLLKEYKMISGINGGFVWLDDENFLFTRQIWKDILRFREMPRLFCYNLKTGEEKYIDSDMLHLFGGFTITEDI